MQLSESPDGGIKQLLFTIHTPKKINWYFRRGT